MTIITEFLESNTINNYPAKSKAIFEILKEIDKEFVPYLSERQSTITKSLKEKSSLNGLKDYYHALLQQNFILIKDSNDFAGFISFINNHQTHFLNDFRDSNYITTIGVKKSFRRMGLARKLYEELFKVIKNGEQVTTRTWSGNISHINLLKELNFNELLRLKDDRKKGVDTIYYGRRI